MTCEVHPGVQWYVPTHYVVDGLEPVCFICHPEWWAEHPPHPMSPPAENPATNAASVMEILQEMVDSGHWPCQLPATPRRPDRGTTAKEATA